MLQTTLSSGEWYVDNNQLAEQLSLAQRCSVGANHCANNGCDYNSTSANRATTSSSSSSAGMAAPRLVPIKSFQNELVNMSVSVSNVGGTGVRPLLDFANNH